MILPAWLQRGFGEVVIRFYRKILCEFRDGSLRLSGTVPTFHLKQAAQELAAHTPGVREVQNDLQVTSQRRRRNSED